MALRTLAETPGLADTDAVQRALAKVEAAAGRRRRRRDRHRRAGRHRAVAAGAAPGPRRVAGRCGCATRPRPATSTTERTVDPLRVFESDGHAYLEAWCRRAEGMRVFRVDRIEDVTLLDEPARPPGDVQLRDLSEGVFQPASDHLLVELRVSAAYAWVADYYVAEDVHGAPRRRGCSSACGSPSPAWVRALVLGSGGQVEVLSPGLAGRVDPRRGRAGAGRLRGELGCIPCGGFDRARGSARSCVAAVVLGFCAYEIGWKSRSGCSSDLARLTALAASLAEVQAGCRAAVRTRLQAQAGSGRHRAAVTDDGQSRAPAPAPPQDRTPRGACPSWTTCGSCAAGVILIAARSSRSGAVLGCVPLRPHPGLPRAPVLLGAGSRTATTPLGADTLRADLPRACWTGSPPG